LRASRGRAAASCRAGIASTHSRAPAPWAWRPLRAAPQLQAAKAKLSAEAVRIERGNGLTALERIAAGSLDAVFLDPPFDSTALYEPSLRAAARAVKAGGAIYLEAPKHWTDEELAALCLVGFRYLKAGAVHAHLLRHVANGTA
jgi:16S rRNA G966 N2-methylase RsmD